MILSMLPSSENVREAYLGPRGVAAAEGGIRASLLIDCSTIDPVSSRQIAQAMQAAPLHSSARPFWECGEAHPAMIDAPVSGGVTGASAGTLTFMVGLPWVEAVCLPAAMQNGCQQRLQYSILSVPLCHRGLGNETSNSRPLSSTYAI